MTDEQIANMKQTGPEIDEETAVALAVAINNHITRMKLWERKLRAPFLPRPYYSRDPLYPKPTLASMLQVMVDVSTLKLDVLRISNTFLKRHNAKEKE